jgi:DNA repair exonuclease SbcCD ATPase subunit
LARIIHIADIHWRGLSRHKEYVQVFEKLFSKIVKLKPDLIYVGGDIVHSKTQGISPELIDNLIWWFKSMGDICPTHVILGNHDGLMMNKDRQDAITPILTALDHPNIFLYKESGMYPVVGTELTWCVFSCFDEENWVNVKPVPGRINIALYHGAVRGSLTDTDWTIDGEVNASIFKDFDFALLGDIHKRQYLTKRKNVAYCGSTIQQNYGEDADKGFLVWDINTASDFKSKFYRLNNPYQFVTVDWSGSTASTLQSCKKYPSRSRFRIRSSVPITQAESKRLQVELKHIKDAKEVVFKVESSFDVAKIKAESIGESRKNLRDPKTHIALLKDYYRDAHFKESTYREMSSIIEKCLMNINKNEENLRNISWAINRLTFDNTFVYGEGNSINFNTLPGITGIFGRNARGKSSIIGALMYCLFNTSDRGSIKNIHIINSRKSMCKASVDISIGGNKYRISRQTIKKSTKSGEWAPTSLNFYRLNDNDEIVEDLSDEQRRSTENVIRKMIGTSEEFLLTSLASQGEMNQFIKEKATARKAILTNFLDLRVFEKIQEIVKSESASLRIKTKNLDSDGWDTKIKDLHCMLDDSKNKKISIEQEIEELEKEIDEIKSRMFSQDTDAYITQDHVDILKRKYSEIANERSDKENRLKEIESETLQTRTKVKKGNDFLSNFDIEMMKKKYNAQLELERKLLSIKSSYNVEKKEYANIKKSVSKLKSVPCGTQFPDCKFIKESHKNSNRIDNQEKKVTTLLSKLNDIELLFSELCDENLEDKIEKYSKIVQRKSMLEVSLASYDVEYAQVKSRLDSIDSEIDLRFDEYKNAESKLNNEDNEIIQRYRSQLENKKEEKDLCANERDKLIRIIARSQVSIKDIEHQKSEFEKLHKSLKVYDAILQAVSNKGIPLQLINVMLPAINEEITKILQGVVNFTAELETDLDSNSMDIYINYGDSRRIIELASGMEKMISSLAIRVALINVSSMSKTSALIIDEGFGTLDELNLEACSRLLQSLKKWFRNIFVISHVDMIKDSVDHTLEITKKGIDSYVSNE